MIMVVGVPITVDKVGVPVIGDKKVGVPETRIIPVTRTVMEVGVPVIGDKVGVPVIETRTVTKILPSLLLVTRRVMMILLLLHLE